MKLLLQKAHYVLQDNALWYTNNEMHHILQAHIPLNLSIHQMSVDYIICILQECYITTINNCLHEEDVVQDVKTMHKASTTDN